MILSYEVRLGLPQVTPPTTLKVSRPSCAKGTFGATLERTTIAFLINREANMR
jgi:hypothetical protein